MREIAKLQFPQTPNRSIPFQAAVLHGGSGEARTSLPSAGIRAGVPSPVSRSKFFGENPKSRSSSTSRCELLGPPPRYSKPLKSPSPSWEQLLLDYEDAERNLQEKQRQRLEIEARLARLQSELLCSSLSHGSGTQCDGVTSTIDLVANDHKVPNFEALSLIENSIGSIDPPVASGLISIVEEPARAELFETVSLGLESSCPGSSLSSICNSMGAFTETGGPFYGKKPSIAGPFVHQVISQVKSSPTLCVYEFLTHCERGYLNLVLCDVSFVIFESKIRCVLWNGVELRLLLYDSCKKRVSDLMMCPGCYDSLLCLVNTETCRTAHEHKKFVPRYAFIYDGIGFKLISYAHVVFSGIGSLHKGVVVFPELITWFVKNVNAKSAESWPGFQLRSYVVAEIDVCKPALDCSRLPEINKSHRRRFAYNQFCPAPLFVSSFGKIFYCPGKELPEFDLLLHGDPGSSPLLCLDDLRLWRIPWLSFLTQPAAINNKGPEIIRACKSGRTGTYKCGPCNFEKVHFAYPLYHSEPDSRIGLVFHFEHSVCDDLCVWAATFDLSSSGGIYLCDCYLIEIEFRLLLYDWRICLADYASPHELLSFLIIGRVMILKCCFLDMKDLKCSKPCLSKTDRKVIDIGEEQCEENLFPTISKSFNLLGMSSYDYWLRAYCFEAYYCHVNSPIGLNCGFAKPEFDYAFELRILTRNVALHPVFLSKFGLGIKCREY